MGACVAFVRFGGMVSLGGLVEYVALGGILGLGALVEFGEMFSLGGLLGLGWLNVLGVLILLIVSFPTGCVRLMGLGIGTAPGRSSAGLTSRSESAISPGRA